MLPPHVVLGTAYYPEYLPRSLGDRIPTDLDLMVAAGITAVRVGESVWSTWEPNDGVFDLEWIRPVLDGARDRGMGVILGTPTYAVPPWLQRANPEIAAERRTGVPVPWGIRQEIDYGQPAFLFHAERVVRRIVERSRVHLIVGPRTGYADPEARPRPSIAPGRLREAAGMAYQEFENLDCTLPVSGLDGHATRWAETLLVDDADVLATYEHPGGGRRPIVTTKRFGAGRVTYVGTVPDRALAAALYGESRLWAPSVTAMSAVNACGERLWFVHNWSGAAVSVEPPVPVEQLVPAKEPASGRIELGAWDVRVLKEAQ